MDNAAGGTAKRRVVKVVAGKKRPAARGGGGPHGDEDHPHGEQAHAGGSSALAVGSTPASATVAQSLPYHPSAALFSPDTHMPLYTHPSPAVVPHLSPDVLQSVLRRACDGLARSLGLVAPAASAPMGAALGGAPIPAGPVPFSVSVPCGPIPSADPAHFAASSMHPHPSSFGPAPSTIGGGGGNGSSSASSSSAAIVNYYQSSHIPPPDFAAFLAHPSHLLFSLNDRHATVLRRLRAHIGAAAQLGNRSSHALWGTAQSGKRRIITSLGTILRGEGGVGGGGASSSASAANSSSSNKSSSSNSKGMLVIELDGNVIKGDDEAIRRIVEETRRFLAHSPAAARLRRQRLGIHRLGLCPTLHDLLALGDDFEMGLLGDDVPPPPTFPSDGSPAADEGALLYGRRNRRGDLLLASGAIGNSGGGGANGGGGGFGFGGGAVGQIGEDVLDGFIDDDDALGGGGGSSSLFADGGDALFGDEDGGDGVPAPAPGAAVGRSLFAGGDGDDDAPPQQKKKNNAKKASGKRTISFADDGDGGGGAEGGADVDEEDDDNASPSGTSPNNDSSNPHQQYHQQHQQQQQRFTAGPASSTISGALAKLQACLVYFNSVGINLIILVHDVRAFGQRCDRVMYLLSGLLHEASSGAGEGYGGGGEEGGANSGSSGRNNSSNKGTYSKGKKGSGHNDVNDDDLCAAQGGVSFVVSSLAPDVTLEKRLSSRLTCEMWYCPPLAQPPLALLPALFQPVNATAAAAPGVDNNALIIHHLAAPLEGHLIRHGHHPLNNATIPLSPQQQQSLAALEQNAPSATNSLAELDAVLLSGRSTMRPLGPASAAVLWAQTSVIVALNAEIQALEIETVSLFEKVLTQRLREGAVAQRRQRVAQLKKSTRLRAEAAARERAAFAEAVAERRAALELRRQAAETEGYSVVVTWDPSLLLNSDGTLASDGGGSTGGAKGGKGGSASALVKAAQQKRKGGGGGGGGADSNVGGGAAVDTTTPASLVTAVTVSDVNFITHRRVAPEEQRAIIGHLKGTDLPPLPPRPLPPKQAAALLLRQQEEEEAELLQQQGGSSASSALNFERRSFEELYDDGTFEALSADDTTILLPLVIKMNRLRRELGAAELIGYSLNYAQFRDVRDVGLRRLLFRPSRRTRLMIRVSGIDEVVSLPPALCSRGAVAAVTTATVAAIATSTSPAAASATSPAAKSAASPADNHSMRIQSGASGASPAARRSRGKGTVDGGAASSVSPSALLSSTNGNTMGVLRTSLMAALVFAAESLGAPLPNFAAMAVPPSLPGRVAAAEAAYVAYHTAEQQRQHQLAALKYQHDTAVAAAGGSTEEDGEFVLPAAYAHLAAPTAPLPPPIPFAFSPAAAFATHAVPVAWTAQSLEACRALLRPSIGSLVAHGDVLQFIGVGAVAASSRWGLVEALGRALREAVGPLLDFVEPSMLWSPVLLEGLAGAHDDAATAAAAITKAGGAGAPPFIALGGSDPSAAASSSHPSLLSELIAHGQALLNASAVKYVDSLSGGGHVGAYERLTSSSGSANGTSSGANAAFLSTLSGNNNAAAIAAAQQNQNPTAALFATAAAGLPAPARLFSKPASSSSSSNAAKAGDASTIAPFALPPSGIASLTDLLDEGNLVRLGYACTEHILLLSFIYVRTDAGLRRNLRDLQEDIASTMRDTSAAGIGIGVGMLGSAPASGVAATANSGAAFDNNSSGYRNADNLSANNKAMMAKGGVVGGGGGHNTQRIARDAALATAFADLKEWGLVGEDRHGDVFIVGPSVRLHDFLRWFLADAAMASQLGMDAMSRQTLANMVR